MPLLVILVGSLKLKVRCLLLAERTLEWSQFYSFKSHIILGEIDYVKTHKDDYKNKANRDRFAGSPVVCEKEAPLLLS